MWKPQFGYLKDYSLDVKFKPGVPPRICNPRTVSYAVKEGLNKYTIGYRLPSSMVTLMSSDAIIWHQTTSDAIRRHQTPSDAIRCHQMPPDAIRCHQMPSDATRCHQMPSDAIRCHQMPSDAIRCHQMQSDVIRCHQLPSSSMWSDSTVTSMRKLKTAYNNSLRRVLNMSKYNSASEMFVNYSIFRWVIHNFIFSFRCRNQDSSMSLVNSIVKSSLTLFSEIWVWWSDILNT